MPDHSHRARSGPSPRVLALAAGVLMVLAVTSMAVFQIADDPGPERVRDLTGLAPVTTQPEPSEDATGVDPTPAAEQAKAKQRKDREAERLAETAVKQRSVALGALVALAEKKAKQDRIAATAPFSVTIGSFNVLGSQHTAPGGDRGNFPPASSRSVGAANRIADHGVDILGTQELQDDQLRALQARTGMAAYPGFQWGVAETDNSILYDAGRFEFVSGDRFTIPFMGRPRPQPILRLRERVTGREFYVVNTHPSAHDGRYLVERRQGQATLVSVVNDLKASGLPVLVTGDMNDREIFYCNVVPQAGLSASNGGSYSSGCRPPPSPVSVDWVVGSGVSWSGYRRDTTPVTSRISDHFFISAVATFG
ncbi:MAG: endonuclease/exonuclease/phosphatase family protein [Nocardioides sp.]